MDVIRTAIGLMSGTSMDGIDVALIRTDGRGFIERGPFMGVPYDADFRGQLKRALELSRPLTDRSERPAELREIELELTLRHAIAVTAFMERFGLAADAVDVLGFHGQTVLHRPDEGLTIQIGDGGELAKRTAISVVYDMRANDMVHGGQGAPLVPAYHAALAGKFQQAGQAVCFVNIGGISNLTFIGTDGRISAFDSGPGNTLIDQWVEMQTGRTYDPAVRSAGEERSWPAWRNAICKARSSAAMFAVRWTAAILRRFSPRKRALKTAPGRWRMSPPPRSSNPAVSCRRPQRSISSAAAGA